MMELAQVCVDVMAYFLPAFAVIVAVSWVVSLFRYK